jgi:hypothetical protein
MPRVVWNADAILAKCKQAGMDGAEEWARVDVLPLADENCPTDTGTMKGTHAVVREGMRIEIGYGGPAAPYAERQHEDMTLSHPSGEAKWLENAFNSKLPALSEKVNKRLKGVI